MDYPLRALVATPLGDEEPSVLAPRAGPLQSGAAMAPPRGYVRAEISAGGAVINLGGAKTGRATRIVASEHQAVRRNVSASAASVDNMKICTNNMIILYETCCITH